MLNPVQAFNFKRWSLPFIGLGFLFGASGQWLQFGKPESSAMLVFTRGLLPAWILLSAIVSLMSFAFLARQKGWREMLPRSIIAFPVLVLGYAWSICQGLVAGGLTAWLLGDWVTAILKSILRIN